jgi:hypothetical protein
MPIKVALFSKEIGGNPYAFDTGDIAFGDAETKEVTKNVGSGIVKFTLRKRQVTFTIRGVNAAQITNLYAERDNSVLRLVSAVGEVTGEDITIGADTIYSALLLDVQAGPPTEIAGIPLIEQVTVRYDSQVFV